MSARQRHRAAGAAPPRGDRTSPAPMLQVAETVVDWLRPEGPGDVAARTATWGSAEWAAARNAALVHGVAPLLAHRLRNTTAWEAIAPELRAYCADQLALNGARLAAIGADLGAILGAAAAAGLAVMPLKGLVLAERFYPAPGLRPMADLDLLVRPADLPRLDALLRGLGYAMKEETPRHRAYLRGALVVAAWDGEHPDNPRGVEVHVVVGEGLRAISYEITAALWAGATPGTCAGQPCLMPTAAGLLHHLLIHTCHNLFYRRLRLIQLYDVALVTPHVDEASWEALVAHTEQAGEARLLFAPLTLAEAVFGSLAPPQARERLAAGSPTTLRRLLRRLSVSEVSLCNRFEVSASYRLAWYRPGVERFSALLRVVLPARVELRQRYPTAAWGLPGAYLNHAGHTAGIALRSVLGRTRRSPSGR